VRPITPGTAFVDLAGFTLTNAHNKIPLVDGTLATTRHRRLRRPPSRSKTAWPSAATATSTSSPTPPPFREQHSWPLNQAYANDDGTLLVTATRSQWGSTLTLANTAAIHTDAAVTVTGPTRHRPRQNGTAP
jgi:hypothetical protein